jgi:phage-related protein
MHVLSNIGKHILGTLQKAFRRIFVSFMLVFLIVATATEAAGVFLNGGKFPPDGTTHLAAAALAIAFGYAVAITIAIEEILRGIVKSIELVVQETEKLAGEAIGEVEKLGKSAFNEAGSLAGGAVHSVEGVAGGVGREFRSVEQGIASHLPGHHPDA